MMGGMRQLAREAERVITAKIAEDFGHAVAVAGELIDSHHESPHDYRRAMVHAAGLDLYPGLASVVRARPVGPPSDHFAENLQRILDGLRLPN